MVKMTHSTQEVGNLAAQNAQTYADLSANVKLLSDNQLISTEQADKFNERLASARETTDALAAKKSFKKIAKDINLAERNATKFAQLQSRLNKMLETKSIKKSKYDDLSRSLAEVNSRLSETEKSAGFKNIEQQMAGANKQSSGFLSNLVGSVKQTGKFAIAWGIINTAIQLAVNMVKNIVNNVKELDAAFTNIRMVTGQTTAEANAMAHEYAELAYSMGSTTKEVTAGANDWLRAGMSVADTNEALEASLTLTKVGALDSAEATKILISAMRGYNLGANELMTVVDKLSAVDVAASVSTEDLGLALEKGAASARLAGIDMDKYLGYVAAVAETSQESGDVIGNSFKTIFARAQKVKLGETLDEDGEDISNYFSDVDEAMAGIGINWAQATNNLNDLGAGLDQLAQKWDSLTSAQKRQVAEAIAGQRQTDRFLILMENYDRAMELAETSTNSAGSAAAKMDKWLESIGARLNQAKVAWERVGQAFIDSGLADTIVDFIVELSDTLALVIETVTRVLHVVPIFQIFFEELALILDVVNKFFELILTGLEKMPQWFNDALRFVRKEWLGWDIREELNKDTKAEEDNTKAKKKATEHQEKYNEKLAQYNALIAAGKAELSSFAKKLKKVIDARDEENKRLEQEKTIQEKILAVEEAREALAEAKQKRVLVYRLGKGFVYEEDFSAVQEAQEKLNEAIADYDKTIDDINFETLQDMYNTLANPSDDLVNNWKEYFRKWGSLAETEYANLLNEARKFVEEYAKTMSIGAPTAGTASGHGVSGANPSLMLTAQYKYASGTTSASGGLSLVGEEGAELRVLNKGDGIIPANITKNLWELGKNPQKVGGNSTHISIGNISLPNVTDTDSFLMELNKIAVPTGGSLK